MIDAAARARRSALALAVVVGMMVALFTACCCLDLDRAPAGDPGPAAYVAAQAGASHDVTVGRDRGHTEQDCQESVAAVAVSVGAASVAGPPAVAVVSMAGQVTPWAVAPVRVASPPRPVPHLLCVMRT